MPSRKIDFFCRYENRWATAYDLLKTLDCARAYKEKGLFEEFAAFLANIDVANNKMTNQDIFEISELESGLHTK